MPIITPSQTNFNGGQLGKSSLGRTDLAVFANSGVSYKNIIPMVQGGFRKRSGFIFVGDGLKKMFVYPFRFNERVAFVFIFTAGKIHIAGFGGILMAGTGVNPNITTGAYALDTPYTDSDLFNTDGTFGLDFAQSGDTIFISCRGRRLAQVIRFSNTSWGYSYVEFKTSPFNLSDAEGSIAMFTRELVGEATPPDGGGSKPPDGVPPPDWGDPFPPPYPPSELP